MLFLIAFCTIVGLVRGAKQELYCLMIWTLGMFIAWFFSQNFALFLLKSITAPALRLGASFVALLTLTLTVGTVIKIMLGNTFRRDSLTLTQRLGGLVLGPVHGFAAVFALVLVAGLTPLPRERWWRESVFIPPFQVIVSAIKANSNSKLAHSINYSHG